MSDATCPVCSIEWPDFCPLDGSKLSGAWTCPNAGDAPAAEAAPAPAPRAESAPEPTPAARTAVARQRVAMSVEEIAASSHPNDTVQGWAPQRKTSGKVVKEDAAAEGEDTAPAVAEADEAPRWRAPEPGSGQATVNEPTSEMQGIPGDELPRRAAAAAAATSAAKAEVKQVQIATDEMDGYPSDGGDDDAAAAAAAAEAEAAAEAKRARIVREGQRPTAAVPDEDMKRTRLEMTALVMPTRDAPEAPAAASGATVRAARGLEPKPLASRAPQPSADDEPAPKPKKGVLSRIASAVKGGAGDAEAMPGDSKGKKGKKGSRRDRGFSETQWFLEGVQGEVVEGKADPEKYTRDDSIPEDVRKKFTLRKEPEE